MAGGAVAGGAGGAVLDAWLASAEIRVGVAEIDNIESGIWRNEKYVMRNESHFPLFNECISAP